MRDDFLQYLVKKLINDIVVALDGPSIVMSSLWNFDNFLVRRSTATVELMHHFWRNKLVLGAREEEDWTND